MAAPARAGGARRARRCCCPRARRPAPPRRRGRRLGAASSCSRPRSSARRRPAGRAPTRRRRGGLRGRSRPSAASTCSARPGPRPAPAGAQARRSAAPTATKGLRWLARSRHARAARGGVARARSTPARWLGTRGRRARVRERSRMRTGGIAQMEALAAGHAAGDRAHRRARTWRCRSLAGWRPSSWPAERTAAALAGALRAGLALDAGRSASATRARGRAAARALHGGGACAGASRRRCCRGCWPAAPRRPRSSAPRTAS